MALYAVKADFAGIKFWAESISAGRGRRIIEHRAFGRDGSDTEDTGRDAYRDTIRGRLSKIEYGKLSKIINEGKVRTWTHPIHGTYKARLHVTREEFSANTYPWIVFDCEIVEDVSQPLAIGETKSAETAKDKGNAFDDDINEKLTDGTFDDDDTVTNAKTDLDNKWTDLHSEIEGYEGGTSTSEDLDRALTAYKNAADSMINALHNIGEYRDGSYGLVTDLLSAIQNAQDLVNTVRADTDEYAVKIMNNPTDVYSLCLELYGSTENAATILARNNIIDPFFLEIAAELKVPVS